MRYDFDSYYMPYEVFRKIKNFLENINPQVYLYMRQELGFPCSGDNRGEISCEEIEEMRDFFECPRRIIKEEEFHNIIEELRYVEYQEKTIGFPIADDVTICDTCGYVYDESDVGWVFDDTISLCRSGMYCSRDCIPAEIVECEECYGFFDLPEDGGIKIISSGDDIDDCYACNNCRKKEKIAKRPIYCNDEDEYERRQKIEKCVKQKKKGEKPICCYYCRRCNSQCGIAFIWQFENKKPSEYKNWNLCEYSWNQCLTHTKKEYDY